ncbi:hypothetical protein GCM10011335_42220 [Aureimonas glaciei]|uniref:Uncharacterized protein n=1 Tax=Aureimonas glaciei TaxID=1776957 RepID=A0A916Y8Y4_9HYPH|nr:hypothetical protein GCM10011335_42220 [Aureimonas glaciei]
MQGVRSSTDPKLRRRERLRYGMSLCMKAFIDAGGTDAATMFPQAQPTGSVDKDQCGLKRLTLYMAGPTRPRE